MQLAEQGKIDLEAPVRRFLPDFKTTVPEESDRIRVKDLLYQTSGFSKFDGVAALTQGDSTIGDHIGRLSKTSLVRAPGTSFEYSNLNYNVLGGLVESVSGTSYATYVKSHLFEPLDMKSSFGSPQEAGGADLAAGYQSVFGFKTPTRQLAHTGTVPSGYLISTAEDMTHYLSAQMNGGRYKEKQVWSEKSGAAMHKPEASMGGGASYAMGWTVKNGVFFHDGAPKTRIRLWLFMATRALFCFLTRWIISSRTIRSSWGYTGFCKGRTLPLMHFRITTGRMRLPIWR